MAKILIPEELDALINEYLTDGVLTEKERQVILKKAVGMGLDRDEIDLYLDAQVQKIDQATDAAVRRQKSKSCPYCGAPVPQLADKCPECGQFITPEASKELQEILDNLEGALVDMKAGKDISRSKALVERYVRKAKMYYGSNPRIQKLLNEIESESTLTFKKAELRKKKENFVKVLSKLWSPWTLLIVEMLVVGFLFSYSSNNIKMAKERYRDLQAQVLAHPDYHKSSSETKSLEFEQLEAEKEKAWEESKSDGPMWIIGIGLWACLGTFGVALRKSLGMSLIWPLR